MKRMMAVVSAALMTVLSWAVESPNPADVTPARAQNACRLTFSGYEGVETLRDFPALVKIDRKMLEMLRQK